ncbi:MAG: hypothetical protein C4555_01235 [Dehalococcoidia bacterium]|nr:MAG: hypothetical protein C4555_01235 [Dehalococcoidia bacterium]
MRHLRDRQGIVSRKLDDDGESTTEERPLPANEYTKAPASFKPASSGTISSPRQTVLRQWAGWRVPVGEEPLYQAHCLGERDSR